MDSRHREQRKAPSPCNGEITKFSFEMARHCLLIIIQQKTYWQVGRCEVLGLKENATRFITDETEKVGEKTLKNIL